MTDMRLPKLPDHRPSEVAVILSGELRGALDEYAELYRASYGVGISLIELIPAILSEFLASDHAFATSRNIAKSAPQRQGGSVIFSDEPERLLQLKQVCNLIGLGKSTIYQMIQNGKFPAPYKLSPGSSRWSEAEILTWIAEVKGGEGRATHGH